MIGVRTDGGDELAADLVVDAMGRGSRLPRLLAAAGLEPGADETVGAGFAYYSRYFRGAEPVPRAPRLTHLGSFSVLTLTGDSGTWSVTLYAAAADRPLKRLRHADAFTAVVRALPRHAHWLEGEPLTGVLPMGGVIDRLRAGGAADAGRAERRRRLGVHEPDAGPRHRGRARARRAAARRRARADRRRARGRLARAHRRGARPLLPLVVASDRGRLAAMAAHREGREPPAPATPAEAVGAALPLAMGRDAEAFRAGLEIIGCLAPAHEVLARPGLAERILALAGSAPPPELERGALLDLIAA